MDSFTIKVATAKLTSAASEFEQTGKDINNKIKEMNSLANQITTTIWEGEAKQRYINKFDKFTDQSNHLEEMISAHADALTQIATEYENAESAAINAAQALADNVF